MKVLTMKLLILALSVVSLRADTPATCLAGSDGADAGNTAETDENCTANGITDEATCDVDGNGLVCAYTAAVCDDDSNECTTNTATDGVCSGAVNVENATSCDDGDAGTEGDVCTDGTCAGTAIPTYGTDATCLAGSDGADAGNTADTDENCTANGDAATCDVDGNGLVCAYTAAVCTVTGNECTESVATDGVCGAPANVTDGTECDDSDAGTETDVCTSGTCAGTAIVVPTYGTDATCLAGSDGADAGNTADTDENCTARGITDAATCDVDDNGLVCAYTAATCTDTSNDCTESVAVDGVCGAPTSVTDGTSCDDSDADTETDVCTSGVCAGTPTPAPVVATYGTDATCLAGSDGADAGNTAETDQNCTARDITDAATCDSEGTGLVCAYAEAVCTDTANACTESLAAAGVCAAPTSVTDGTSCDDADAATETDVCTSGVCAGTPTPAPVVAHSGDATCLAGSDGADGGNTAETDENCTARDITDAATCDTEGTGLVCAYTAAVCADEGNACTTNTATDGVCATANVADATVCDDADADTENDVCTSGVCAGTTADVPADETAMEGTDAPSDAASSETEPTSPASHAQAFAALASAFLLL